MTTAIDALTQAAGDLQPRIAVILGSGWGGLTGLLRGAVRIAYADLPGFPRPGVAGHGGELWLGRLDAQPVAVLAGRQHGYETGAVDAMASPLQVLQQLGCHTLVQTNAAGSLHPEMASGSLMLLSDHLNLPQRSPLVGLGGNTRFVDMVDAYDPDLRAQARRVADAQGIPLHEGVYAWAFGPQFETPAEIRMLQRLGADAVGMSTVPETILARHLGLRVLALSLITNLGAGLSTERLSHAHTLAQAQAASARASRLLADIVAAIEAPKA